MARYSELLYTWGIGERLELSGYAAGGGVLLVGSEPRHHPAGVLEDGSSTLLKRWEQEENWPISTEDSSSLVSSSSESKWRYLSERAESKSTSGEG